MSARAAAASARARLEAAGVPDAAIEAETLTRHASGLDRAAFFAGAPIDGAAAARLEALLARRLRREPTPYLTGVREFHGVELAVGRGALIPRPETELLVELGLAELRERPDATVLDVGAGCGAVALALALVEPRARVLATDVSADALRLAARNVARHGVAVALARGHLADAVARADVVLANLPYVPARAIDALQPEIRRWEPRLALDGGADGLDLVRALLDDCGARLRPRLAALEVGPGQAGPVAAYAAALGAETDVARDLAGRERAVTARWR